MIKSILVNVLIVAAVVLLQSTALHFFAFYGIIPDMVMIFILFISLKGGSKKGEITGFAGGLLIDFISLSPLGFHCIVYTVIGFVAGLTEKNVSTDSLLTQIIFVLIGSVIKYLLFSLLIVIFSIESTSFALFGRNFFIEFLFTMFLTPIIFTIANKIYDATHRKRVGL